jgi:hypothetical protein
MVRAAARSCAWALLSADRWSARGNAPGKEAFGEKQPSLLVGTSGLLVEELLAAGSLLTVTSSSSLLVGASGSSLLVGVNGLLVKELLAMSCLLLFASSLLLNMALAGRRLEAVALVLP